MSSTDPGVDLSALPPGLVAYMAGGHNRIDNAFNLTLASLAQRGWLLLAPEDTGASTAQLARWPSKGDLPRSEELVLERVQARSRSMPTVPLSELTNRDGEAYQKWSKNFRRALDEESRRTGLTRRTAPSGFFFPISLGIAIVLSTAAAGISPGNRANAVVGVGFIGLVVGLITAAFMTAHRPTALGKMVIAQARRARGQSLNQILYPGVYEGQRPDPAAGGAIADAVGPTRSPEQALLEKDARSLPDNQAWSSQTGKWRVVDIRPVENPVLKGRPLTLFKSVVSAAFFTGVASLLGLAVVRGVKGEALAAAPGTIFVLYTCISWIPNFFRRIGIVRRVVIPGQVVKRWTFDPKPNDDDTPVWHCLTVDDGTADAAQSFKVPRDVYKRLQVGDAVVVHYSPRWRKTLRIRRAR